MRTARQPLRYRSRAHASLLGLALYWAPSLAQADLDVGKLVEQWRFEAADLSRDTGDSWRALTRRSDGRIRLLVRQRQWAASNQNTSLTTTGSDPLATTRSGMLALRPGIFTWTATPEEIAVLSDERPDLRFTWSAPRRVLLDAAVPLVRADVVQRVYGLKGSGVAIGIVDTGLDIGHADLRRADGTSRIAWLLDLSRQPAGRHAELERAFGCDAKETPCAVYSGTDLDEMLANDVVNDEPRDTFGHGTHVASLAAGNGLSNPGAPKFVGMAPEATIIAVRATRDDTGLIEDPDILTAVKFIFDIADQQLKLPAVINLSLGGDFGAHDGTSELERELAAYVGSDKPGHSIVVAAGNSGSLYEMEGFPSALGIHTVVQVPPHSTARVPLLIGDSVEPNFRSGVYAWIASRPGDWLRVGLDSDQGKWIAPVAIGSSRKAKDHSGEYQATIQNGVTDSDDPASIDYSGAAILIEGAFEEAKTFYLVFEGFGTASIWVQPAGGIDPASAGGGAWMPGAQREGTISIPATSSSLISVGASANRVSWSDIDGVTRDSPYLASYPEGYFEPNTVLPFSAAGPTATDGLKPDVVAPGGWVAGAMSSLADPRTLIGRNSMFLGSAAECDPSGDSCLVVDPFHSLSTGTSMASPVVAGAIALLLEHNPRLTQPEIAIALRAGAKAPVQRKIGTAQIGAGLLDVENALLCLRGEVSPATRADRSNSWLGLGNSYAHPDPNWPIPGFLHLRDDVDRAVDIELSRISLHARNGIILSPLSTEAPGFYRFTAAANAATAGQQLTIEARVDGERVVSVQRDIALDATSLLAPPVAGRGCALSLPSRAQPDPLWLAVMLAAAARFCRIRRLTSKRRDRSAPPHA